MQKEQTGLEGRFIDIGNFKVQIRNAIAEGGFSCVYSARDAVHGSKQYALKHIICNDEESQELVMKEISVMKTLKGHPNVVTLHAHAIFDMGRTKEAFLLMEYCEKSLVNVLESRGAGFFEEKQVLTIFRDACNAVFAMHCQTPPIAHRDLKAENLLLGSDGLWKLCDFGSISTNHKRFEKPEEMGIEEDNIRKHTTPAYRAPEMWDLFRRELINEKVDIWVWFRVNDLLPEGLQKSLPDRPPEMLQHGTDVLAGMPKPANKSSPMPRRSPPPPPSSEAPRNVSSTSNNLRSGESTGPLGAFWSTQHAKDNLDRNTERLKQSKPEVTPTFQNDAYNAFVAEFNTPPQSSSNNRQKAEKEEILEAERQEIQDLKQALAARTPSPSREPSRNLASPGSQTSSTPQKEKIEGTVWELQQGFFDRGCPSPDTQQWQAFADDPKPQTMPTNNASRSAQTRNGQQSNQAAELSSGANTWGFGTDSFKVSASPKINLPVGEFNNSQRFGESKSTESKLESQPAGWAGF
ncbi:UNVERIFIED_CONTAM: putative serine/threonine-protein kinase DDB [Sesamum radiatum]|uniref:non-specific serine/threonine protein kinase n=1 Tax=Sesamum radiatum TaxID=300843 RepID=A0AAW2VHJ3_SESRA